MATLVLQAAGAFAGNLVAGSVGAIVGQAAGAIAGNVIDRALFGSIGAKDSQGPRLNAMPGTVAAEGTPVPRVFGRARVGGTLIWMTRFEEVATTTRAGGIGGKGSGPKNTTYSYFANFAVALCEGPVAEVRRIWADGQELDQAGLTIRTYNGSEDQAADPLIVAKEGADDAPSYRGICYVVFERLPLGDFGNRIPQLSFEVVRPVGGIGAHIRGICLIPGSTEFGYAPGQVMRLFEPGETQGENRHQLIRASDWSASLDALQALCPQLESVALVVSWFGDDLRAGLCSIRPRVENHEKAVNGSPWHVAGLTRQLALPVSTYAGHPAYGGTPSDDSVLAAIADLKARGLKVVFYPFVMMDVPHGNTLGDPWSGNAGQPPYPWRGRITCDPAPDVAESVDGTTQAADQVAAFFGTAQPGAGEWSFRRFILHYAGLCAAAGGVDTFIVGSEMVGLTRVWSAPGVYPAASAIASLAGDVKQALPQALVSYAADWTEYGAHVREGGDEVRFPLDPVWSSPHVDFVGIDAYWPLSDWRDGHDHADASIARSVHDVDYLRNNMAAGEGFDWYYADDAGRAGQQRLPITDGSYNKPWIFRVKDLHGWWSNSHFERAGGIELPAPTGWQAASKPIWLVECGCPAVDRGTNAPNVFPDPKSSESRLPYFSRAFHDDLVQARAIEAVISRFTPGMAGFNEAFNPQSPHYDGRMLDWRRIHVWAWDARPFPAFPLQGGVWSDAPSWQTGHWLNGRLEAVQLNDLVRALATQVPSVDVATVQTNLDGMVDGYVIDRPMSPRASIEPLADYFLFDAIVGAGKIRFEGRGTAQAISVVPEEMAGSPDKPLFMQQRGQESELPARLSVQVYDGLSDYETITRYSRRLEGASQRESLMQAPVITNASDAQRQADMILQDIWSGRETIEFALPPSFSQLEAGDHVVIDNVQGGASWRITRIGDGVKRDISARKVDDRIFDHVASDISLPVQPPVPLAGPPQVVFLNLAIARTQPEPLQYVAAHARPWPGPLAVWKASGGSSYSLHRFINAPAMIGVTLDPFGPGPAGRFDHASTLTVRLAFGDLPERDDVGALSGEWALAVEGQDGAWEIIVYTRSELIAAQTWRLWRLVRGIGGQEYLSQRTLPAGARVVVLDEAVVPVTTDLADLHVPHAYRIGPARHDHAAASYVELEAVAGSEALRPLAPARITARRVSGEIAFDVLRRGRIAADAWQPVDIPLGEDSEAYDIEILADGQFVRTLHGQGPRMIYEAGLELQDFGMPVSEIEVRVWQLSAVAGRGYPLHARIPVI